MSESAPRISREAVEQAAKWLFENYGPGELRAYGWDAISVKDHYRAAADQLLNSLDPLLCGEPSDDEQQRGNAEGDGPQDQSMADHEHGLRFVDDEARCLACALRVTNRAREKAKQELEQERQKGERGEHVSPRQANPDATWAEEVASLTAAGLERFAEAKGFRRQLNQVREEVERFERNSEVGNGGELEDPLASIKAILDSSSSVSLDEGSSGDLTVSLSREAMLGFLGYGHPHSAAWFSELVAAFETATGRMVKPNPEQAIRLTYEEAAEKLRSDEAMHTLYCHAPGLDSDNDSGPTPEEEEQLRPVLDALAELFFTQPANSGDVEERGEGEVAPHPEDGRRWDGWRGPLTALLGALRKEKPLCFNGNVLVAFTADVPDSDLWKAQAEMVLDADDLAALRVLAAEPPKKDTHLSGDGERLEEVATHLDAVALREHDFQAAKQTQGDAAFLRDLASRLSSEDSSDKIDWNLPERLRTADQGADLADELRTAATHVREEAKDDDGEEKLRQTYERAGMLDEAAEIVEWAGDQIEARSLTRPVPEDSSGVEEECDCDPDGRVAADCRAEGCRMARSAKRKEGNDAL